MSLFCLLWMPLFYLFWSSLVPEDTTGLSSILALILGSIVALVLFFMGSFVDPGGFGLSRWLSGFIDIVSLPALLPLIIYFLLIPLGLARDFGNFALLWLIPDVALRTVIWSAQKDPILLVLVPLLRTAIVVGISSFIHIIIHGKTGARISGVFGILALPPIGATSYWAFFSQDPFIGFLLFFITIIPMIASIIVLFHQNLKQG